MSANHVNVRLNSNIVMIVDIDMTWNIRRLKQEIANRQNLNSDNLRIIFAGRELSDDLTMQNTDINQSVVHVVEGPPLILEAQTESLTRINLSSQQGRRRAKFYVYCKRCSTVCQGKLRVRCSSCKEGSFILQQGPSTWDDVLKRGRISGTCGKTECSNTTAEFYFKCGNHQSLGDEMATPLRLIKTNVNDIPCLACEEIWDMVLVFPCAERHTMCIDCFRTYCTVKMNDRQFVNSEQYGYTLPCPGSTSTSCSETFIQDFHHFCLLGDLQYNRLKDFAADDFVRQSGGVFCPGIGCGAGYIIEPGIRRAECSQCKLVFCVSCQEPFHDGECNRNRTSRVTETSPPPDSSYRVDPQSASRASQVVIASITKPCPNPKCKVPIEKAAGCMHMTCTMCLYEFCWICRTEWSRECQADHWFG